MKYRRLGTTRLRVSVVGIGCWQFGGEWGKQFQQDEVNAMFDHAEDLGINLADTAECYGDHLSEQFVGEALRGRRDRWVIATKFGHKFHRPFERDFMFDPASVQRQLDDSLKALQTDYIDVYQFHSGDDAAFDADGLWEMLNRQLDAGKIRHLGISIGSNTNIRQTDKADEVGAEVIQVVYNRVDRKPEEEVFTSCIEQDLGVLARVPLASGLLSGKYKADATFAADEVRGKWMTPEQIQETLQQVEQIKQTEVPPGVPMPQWALAWCLQHPAVTAVIPGCKSVEQVASNGAAADLDLVRDDHPQAMI